jgi:hypothetical protein
MVFAKGKTKGQAPKKASKPVAVVAAVKFIKLDASDIPALENVLMIAEAGIPSGPVKAVIGKVRSQL